jgi:hypothetical protein
MKNFIAILIVIAFYAPFLVSDWYMMTEQAPDYFIVTMTNVNTGASTTTEVEAQKTTEGSRLQQDLETLAKGSYKVKAIAVNRLWDERSVESRPFDFSRQLQREPSVFKLER